VNTSEDKTLEDLFKNLSTFLSVSVLSSFFLTTGLDEKYAKFIEALTPLKWLRTQRTTILPRADLILSEVITDFSLRGRDKTLESFFAHFENNIKVSRKEIESKYVLVGTSGGPGSGKTRALFELCRAGVEGSASNIILKSHFRAVSEDFINAIYIPVTFNNRTSFQTDESPVDALAVRMLFAYFVDLEGKNSPGFEDFRKRVGSVSLSTAVDFIKQETGDKYIVICVDETRKATPSEDSFNNLMSSMFDVTSQKKVFFALTSLSTRVFQNFNSSAKSAHRIAPAPLAPLTAVDIKEISTAPLSVVTNAALRTKIFQSLLDTGGSPRLVTIILLSMKKMVTTKDNDAYQMVFDRSVRNRYEAALLSGSLWDVILRRSIAAAIVGVNVELNDFFGKCMEEGCLLMTVSNTNDTVPVNNSAVVFMPTCPAIALWYLGFSEEVVQVLNGTASGRDFAVAKLVEISHDLVALDLKDPKSGKVLEYQIAKMISLRVLAHYLNGLEQKIISKQQLETDVISLSLFDLFLVSGGECITCFADGGDGKRIALDYVFKPRFDFLALTSSIDYIRGCMGSKPYSQFYFPENNDQLPGVDKLLHLVSSSDGKEALLGIQDKWSGAKASTVLGVPDVALSLLKAIANIPEVAEAAADGCFIMLFVLYRETTAILKEGKRQELVDWVSCLPEV